MLIALKWLILVLGVYLVMGLGFAVVFVISGAGRISPAARGAGWGFRLLILPGAAVVWPLLAWRWAVPVPRGGSPVPAVDIGDFDPEGETRA